MKIVQTNSTETIKSAIKKFADLIVPTYGPAGKKVLIAVNRFNLKAADDGHAAAEEFELENEFENSVVDYMREATGKTNSRVGDGTTTAIVLMRAITDKVFNSENPFASDKYYKEVQEIERATKEAVKYIKSNAKEVTTSEELYRIAYNSYNNPEVAKLISETIFKIGKDGVLAIEDSQTAETEIELVEGIEVEKGYASPYLINDKESVVIREPAVLLVNSNLERFGDIMPLIKQLYDSGKKDFVIIADSFGDEFLGYMILNKVRGVFSPLLVTTPGYGEGKLESLKNISAITGATIFDPKIKKLSEATMEDFGIAKKIVSKKDKTTIIGGNEEKIKQRVEELKEQLKQTTSQFNKDKLEKTIASLSGGIALIKVGANTENEQKSIKMKVEDAVNATKAAFKDGVVAGGGKTFAEIETSSPILNEALKAPRKQLEENGKEFLDDNVIDPAGVLVAALETASSIACGLLMMGGIVTTKRKEDED